MIVRNRPASARRRQGFFAFSSRNGHLVGIIERAIKSANDQNRVYIQDWRKLFSAGARPITSIVRAIQKADFVLADLSGMNTNVLFEVGLALGMRKQVFFFIQGHSVVEKDRDLARVDFLRSIHIETITNSEQLARVISQQVSRQPDGVPIIDQYVDFSERPSGALFLRGLAADDVSLECERAYHQPYPTGWVDDWSENRNHQFSWYLDAVRRATAVVALMVNPSWQDAERSNARFALICGIAVALRRTVLMIGLDGYEPSFDYRELLYMAQDPKEAAQAVLDSLSRGRPSLDLLLGRTVTPQPPVLRPPREPSEALLAVAIGSIGDGTAEHEEGELARYFLRTGEYEKARRGTQTLFVGSKGSGKTANFLQLREELSGVKGNLVCAIKPDDYSMGRFVDRLRQVSDEHGGVLHVLEAAWKLVICCELVAAMAKRIASKPAYLSLTPRESALVSFWSAHKHLIEVSFGKKLDVALEWLEQGGFGEENFTKKVHDAFVIEACTLLKPLVELGKRIAVLVDNLDKPWFDETKVGLHVRLVLGLIEAGEAIRHELGGNVGVVVFLRRNIFMQMRRSPFAARLPNQWSELLWLNRELLLKVIDTRVRLACDKHGVVYAEPSLGLFTETVGTKSIKDWICAAVLPRPRDLIEFVERAMVEAVNRGHSRVEPEDLEVALVKYSAWALDQLCIEYQAECPWLAPIAKSFFGGPSELTFQRALRDIQGAAATENLTATPREIVARLGEVGFLGIAGRDGTEYAATVQEADTIRAKLEGHPEWRPLKLRVHPVFCHHLRISKPPKWRSAQVIDLISAGVRSAVAVARDRLGPRPPSGSGHSANF